MSALPQINPLRTLQDAHQPDCLCEACLERDHLCRQCFYALDENDQCFECDEVVGEA